MPRDEGWNTVITVQLYYYGGHTHLHNQAGQVVLKASTQPSLLATLQLPQPTSQLTHIQSPLAPLPPQNPTDTHLNPDCPSCRLISDISGSCC